MDVFIFNVPRSFNTNRVPYSFLAFLEDIKDGRAISSKYNSSELKFVTPNIVVDTLSTDRVDGRDMISQMIISTMDSNSTSRRMRKNTMLIIQIQTKNMK